MKKLVLAAAAVLTFGSAPVLVASAQTFGTSPNMTAPIMSPTNSTTARLVAPQGVKSTYPADKPLPSPHNMLPTDHPLPGGTFHAHG